MFNRIKKIYKKFQDLLDFCLGNSLKVDYYYLIGANSIYHILEIKTNYDVVINDILSKIIYYNLNYYWFRSLSEFELIFDLLDINDQECFIIIG